MPYNLVTSTKYNLDISNIENYIRSNGDFNFSYFDKWLEGWLKVFVNAEVDTQLQISNLQNVQTTGPMEIFLQDVIFNSYEHKLNFVINGVTDYLKKHSVKVQKIPASRFSQDIKWSRMKDNSTKDISEPIFITSLPKDGFKEVVIDGNHRLTTLLSQGAQTVDCVTIKPEVILENDILLFSIDKAIFSFVIEHYVFQQHVKNGTDHKVLFNSSSINTIFSMWNK
ncbi:hypothetical protein ACFX4Y_16875 [Priestia sp. YIM B13446]|uniref:hypothetical protein n=1 Tax=Priestia TaxID=2800373 RepID=UPI001594200A|nr:hypothetical protein [Priestia megaterium]MDC7719491.1 hypothetical protein [Priestia megaterium]